MNDFILAFPFEKVDKAKRTVTGVATADNIDPSGDIIDFEASQEAFAKWVGNIREMHEPKAVGRALDYRPVKVPYHGNLYDGIEVEAYISEGAEATWQKVLDGTLRGFSVGGSTIEKMTGRDKYTGRKGKRISKYALGELSLVDNPGNPAALISLVKRAEDGSLEYALDTYDMFYCAKDTEASIGDSECPSCGGEMDFVGSVNEDTTDIIRKFVATLNQPKVDIKIREDHNMEKLLDNNIDDNVTNMELTTEQTESVLEKFKKFLTGDKEEVALEAVASPVVVNVYTSDIEKAAPAKAKADKAKADAEDAKDGGDDEDEENADGSKKKIKKSSDDSSDNGGNEVDMDIMKAMFSDLLDEKLTAVKEEISASVDEKVETIQKSMDEVSEKADQAVAQVTETIEKVEGSGAIKKSVDDDGDESNGEELKKSADSFWGGMYVPREVYTHLGYDS